MHRFYITDVPMTEETITITGSDVNHIKNVLRLKKGEQIIICNGQGKDCYCIINKVSDTEIIASLQSVEETATELGQKITLFQGLPKKDKMELIIQKAVELGVHEIIPVMTKRVIVKLEDKKKEEKKLERWQAISESAAKQSGRGVIPKIKPVMSYAQALKKAKDMGIGVIPYENAKDMNHTRKIINSLGEYSSIGIFIGPEGGFEEAEVSLAIENGIIPISLGRRILRTETAGLTVLSMMILVLEE